jgi:large subunit ribosomal protein L31e
MAEKTKENKIILEREYIIPLRRKFIDTPFYKKTPKAIKAIKQFIAKHMKVEDRDLRKVKLDGLVNHEMWMHGIRRPLAKIKVKAKKYEDGIVRVELVEIPDVLKFKIEREKKRQETTIEEKKEKVEEKKEEKTEEEKKDIEEKKDSVKEAGQKQADNQAKQMKHEARAKQGPKHQRRTALQK